MPHPSTANNHLAEHIQLLTHSYHHWTGSHLIDPTLDATTAAEKIWNAPFIVLSHDTAPDPILTYANKAGLKLFELTWEELTTMPSRLTAEQQERTQRANLMNAVTKNGYISNYSGIRISKTGKRFTIPRATVWNLLDSTGTYCGQAATFAYPEQEPPVFKRCHCEHD